MSGLLKYGDALVDEGGSTRCTTCGGIVTWDDCSYSVTSAPDPCVTCVGGFVCGMTCTDKCVDVCNGSCSGSCIGNCLIICALIGSLSISEMDVYMKP